MATYYASIVLEVSRGRAVKNTIIWLVILGGGLFVAYVAWNYEDEWFGAKLLRALFAFIVATGLLALTVGKSMDRRPGGIEYEHSGPADPCDVNRYC